MARSVRKRSPASRILLMRYVTKYLGSDALLEHMARAGCWLAVGRAHTAPELSKAS